MLTPERAVENIKSVRIQGANEIAIYSLKFLKAFARKNGFGLKFDVASMMLENTRPTAVVLHNVLEIVKKKKNVKAIDDLVSRLENSKKKIGTVGSGIVKKNYTLLTHCHSGEALSVIENSKNKKISVIATETEPLEQGIKTVKELAKRKIPVTLITDSAVAHFIREVDAIIIGSDSIRKEGFANKVGTLQIAVLAKEFKKPFYVVGNTLKFDRRKIFKIEERPAREVYRKLRGVKIRNPAFDIVPWNYVKAVITERGIFSPQKISRMLK